MANKKISELAVRTPSLTDLMLVGDPSTGYSYKATISSLSSLLEANIALDDLNDVTITSPTAGQVLSYNGTAWVNDTNGITGSGTTNYVPKFTSSSAIGNSQIFDNGTNVGIGTATPDSTSRVEISKTDGYGLYINYTTNTGVAPTASALWTLNNTNLFGYSAIIEEKTPNSGSLQIPLLIKHSLSSGTAQAGNGTGIHFDIPDDAGTFKRMQLSVEATDTAAATYSSRFRFNVRHNNVGTNVLYIAGNGVGIFQNTPATSLDVNGDLKVSTIANATTDTDKFIVSDGGVIKYRTGSEVLSDIGGAAASSISGTPNYIAKFTGSSSIGNTVLYEDGFSLGLGTTAPSPIATGFRSVTINGTNRAYVTLQITGADLGYFYAVPSSRVELSSQTALPLVFSTNASERMRLDASGNLGLGTSNPSAYGGYTTLTLNNNTNGGIIDFKTNNLLYAEISNDATDFLIQTFNSVPIRFATNGSERMVLNASGNLGLGVTPSAWSLGTALEIANGPAILGFNNASFLTNNAYYNGGWIYKATSAASNLVLNNDGSFQFNIAPSGTAGNAISFTQAMTLDASGRLGIGTTSPTYKLEVNNAARVGNSSGGILLSGDGGSGNIWTDIASPLRLGANNAEYMRITSGGELLINTTSDLGDYKLQINGNARVGTSTGSSFNITTNQAAGTSGSPLFTDLNFLGYSDNVQARIRSWDESASTNNGTLAFWTNNSGTAAERMRITSGGDVGIGTSSPARLLDVNGTMRIADGSAVEWGGISTGIAGTSSSNTLLFYTNSSERMRLDASGNLGLGTSSPTYKLNVLASAGTQAIFQAGQTGVSNGYTINSNGTNLTYQWYNGGSEAMRLDASGNLGIGNTSPTQRLDITGNATISGVIYTDAIATRSGTAIDFRDQAAASIMYLDATNKRVGIGTTSPTSRLQSNNSSTYNSSTPSGAIIASNLSGGNAIIDIGVDATYLGYIQSRNVTNTTLYNLLLNPMGGNVGIGTTSPVTNLQVHKPTTGLSGVQVTNSTTGSSISDGLFLGIDDSQAYVWNYENTATVFATNNSERMKITSGGDVGIGTTTPGTKLEVNGAIKTAAPSGGTAKPFKIGAAATVTPTSQNRTIEIEIDGTTYYLTAKTTND